MPDLIKTGKYIYELDSLVGALSKEAYFVVSQDDLTRKITFDDLKTAFNGDNEESGPNNYYSSEMIDRMFEEVYQRLLNMEQDFLELSKKFEEVQTYVQNAYNELSDRLTNLDEEINNRIDQEVKTINTRIDTEVSNINDRIDQEVSTLNTAINNLDRKINDRIDDEVATLNSKINSNYNTLNDRITSIYKELNNKIDNLFDYGTSVPSSLTTGKLYFQYF